MCSDSIVFAAARECARKREDVRSGAEFRVASASHADFGASDSAGSSSDDFAHPEKRRVQPSFLDSTSPSMTACSAEMAMKSLTVMASSHLARVDGPHIMVDISELGRRIRKLRLEHRLTLKQVEQSSGLSATHLSEIERGRTSPTIGALTRIARALSRDASYFIESEERAEVGQLAREARRTLPLAAGVTAEVLTEGIPGSRVFAYRLLLDGDSDTVLELAAQELPGDAFYLVREGALAAEVDDMRLELGPGDSAQVSFDKSHRIRAVGSNPAEVIAVLTRPLTTGNTTDGGPRVP